MQQWCVVLTADAGMAQAAAGQLWAHTARGVPREQQPAADGILCWQYQIVSEIYHEITQLQHEQPAVRLEPISCVVRRHGSVEATRAAELFEASDGALAEWVQLHQILKQQLGKQLRNQIVTNLQVADLSQPLCSAVLVVGMSSSVGGRADTG